MLNDSWRTNLEEICETLNFRNKIIITGVQNSFKSTFTSCLINNIIGKFDKQVYILELDPGQPNYTLAGQLCLLKINEKILTNSDFDKA